MPILVAHPTSLLRPKMPEFTFKKTDAETLLTDLRRANTEQAKKERFLQYLSVAFAKDKTASALISAMAMGAERTIANITRGARLARAVPIHKPKP